ncbi:MAG: DUF3160 domain-containing protein [Planctomycetes bacterium]|nr:DUF3160 domain-containing protein [Planctomycetota bacterium]
MRATQRSRGPSSSASSWVLAAVPLALAAVLAAWPGRALEAVLVADCPEDVLPDLGEDLDPLAPEEHAFLDEFGEAFGRFQGMTLEELRAEYGPAKRYLRSGADFARGDANGDGALDLTDAVCVLSALFLGSGPCASAACQDPQDADDSGRVDITDAIYVLSHLFLGGPAPRPPYPAKGLDPTADELSCAVGSKLGYEPMEAQGLGAILEHYFLSEAQEAAFRENGFVIFDDVRYDTFFQAFNETWTQDMPIYISADAILDTLGISLDRLLQAIEEVVLIRELDAMLSKMDSGIAGLAPYDERGNAGMEARLDDVATWVCTARSLLAGAKRPCARPVDARVEVFLGYVASEALEKNFDYFGMLHCEDFSQFKPRGHYTRSEALQRHFRAMMWVQRMGLKLVQSDRHAALAFLLTRLLHDTGAIEHWARIDATIESIVGVSDSANPPALARFFEEKVLGLADLYDPETFQAFARSALREGLGKQRINSQILMRDKTLAPGEWTPIPPAFHLMGQRFVIDSFVFQNVVHDRVFKRYMPSTLDVWFALGNRAAVPLLASELERYAGRGYHRNLAALDWIVSTYSWDYWAEKLAGRGGGGGEAPVSVYQRDFWSEGLYNVWLSALRELSSDTTSADFPPVMRTEAWDRRMLHAQLGSWAQLRHATVLYPKPSTPMGEECDYPRGWVDPYPAFFEKIAAWAARAQERFAALGLLEVDPTPWMEANTHVGRYLESLEGAARQLAEIARAEVAGRDLSEEETTFILSLLHVHRGAGCGGVPAVFDGWYPKMIYGFDRGKTEPFNPFVADVHTDPNSGGVLHVGVGYPNLMLVSVKNDCGHRAYVGPVFSYHELIPEGPFTRLTDEEWKALLESGADVPRPAWTREIVR